MRSIILVSLTLAMAAPVAGQAPRTMIAPPRALACGQPASVAALRARLSAPQRAWVDTQVARGVDLRQVQGLAATAWPGSDIDALIMLVMAAASDRAEADLRSTMAEIQARTTRKAAQRAPVGKMSQPDDRLETGASDFDTEQTMRIRTLTERRTQADAMLCNVMQKAGATGSGIVGQIK